MHSKKLLVRILLVVLCMMLLSVGLQASARERTLSCSYRKITGNGFVADTFLGVEARYNLGGPTLYCVELIPRFYREVYGVEMSANDSGPCVTDDSGYWFEETDEANVGDVLFASAGARGKGYNHWAICKDVDPMYGRITLFEQNWRWNGCAGVDRVIPQNGCYRIYRLVSEDGRVPTLAEREEMVKNELEKAQDAATRLVVMQFGLDRNREAFRPPLAR